MTHQALFEKKKNAGKQWEMEMRHVSKVKPATCWPAVTFTGTSHGDGNRLNLIQRPARICTVRVYCARLRFQRYCARVTVSVDGGTQRPEREEDGADGREGDQWKRITARQNHHRAHKISPPTLLWRFPESARSGDNLSSTTLHLRSPLFQTVNCSWGRNGQKRQFELNAGDSTRKGAIESASR